MKTSRLNEPQTLRFIQNRILHCGTVNILEWIILLWAGGAAQGIVRCSAASLASTYQMPLAPHP